MSELRQINRNEWPELINIIAEYIGDEAAMKMFIRFAGRHLRVPKTLGTNHVILSIIGPEKAAEFCRVFADEMLIFPTGKQQLIGVRNRRIIEAWQGGITQADIATTHQMSERQINSIINSNKRGMK